MKAIKTEHSGGKGPRKGYRGRRVVAKQVSRKRRRVLGRQEARATT
jgi:hypothetical protein